MTASISPALRAILADVVDYAGLFPPAGLELETALRNHAAYLRGDGAWMLGRFALPALRLPEVWPTLSGLFDYRNPARISALGMKANSASGFLANLRESLQSCAEIPRTAKGSLSIEQFETPLPPAIHSAADIGALLNDAAGLIGSLLPGQLRVYWEVPFSAALPAVVRAVAAHNAQIASPLLGASLPRYRSDGRMIHYSPTLDVRHCQPFGLKLRTGGTEAAAFPPCEQLAEALLLARDAGVALKFTAGLHHPLRHFDDGLGTRMHGFLNVFAAGIIAREHRIDAVEAAVILADEEAESFLFDDDAFAWRHRRVPVAAVAAHREWITSFGSCSFDEPREDLRTLGLLP